jgi:hypothetical protein
VDLVSSINNHAAKVINSQMTAVRHSMLLSGGSEFMYTLLFF